MASKIKNHPNVISEIFVENMFGNEPRRQKTGVRGFRPGPTAQSLNEARDLKFQI